MSASTEERVAAIVLAAGASTRLGRPKQLVRVAGESLLRRTVRFAGEAGCSPVVVVLGFEAERMRAELEGFAVDSVVHSGWMEGMGSSLRKGVEMVRHREPMPEAVLALVCDQPRLTAAHVQVLLQQHRQSHAPVTASRYGGRLGVPAIFQRQLFSELAALTGDRGARDLIRRHGDETQEVAWEDGSIDVDQPEDLSELA